MEINELRWVQRLANYEKAFSQLAIAVQLSRQRTLSDLEQQGLIQAFEFTHELAWKTLKDFLNDKGNVEIYGSRDVTRQAFKYGLLNDGEVWMNMILSRNQTSRTYNEEITKEIVTAILNEYYQAFQNLKDKLKQLQLQNQ
jgi:nucleotidyltransferase substrate binding protein (TIGR01987 family)